MRLVTTMMTKEKLSDDKISDAINILQKEFKNRYEIYKYKYDDSKYYETDIDLFDVIFTKHDIYTNISKLISCYENIMHKISVDIDFIAANDDTHNEVLRYEKNSNDIKDFGLFVTKREIPNAVPYYSSKNCNAYVNLTHVSFGVYY